MDIATSRYAYVATKYTTNRRTNEAERKNERDEGNAGGARTLARWWEDGMGMKTKQRGHTGRGGRQQAARHEGVNCPLSLVGWNISPVQQRLTRSMGSRAVWRVYGRAATTRPEAAWSAAL